MSTLPAFGFLEIPVDTNPTNHYADFEDGLYQVELVGMVVAERTKFQSEEKEPQLKFFFQVLGKDKMLSMKWVKISTYEKSTLMKWLMAWSKSSADAVLTSLKGEQGHVQLANLLGKRATAYIQTQTTTQGKDYLAITTLAPASKTQTEVVNAGRAPKFLEEEKVLQSLWHPSIEAVSVKPPVLVTESPFAASPTPTPFPAPKENPFVMHDHQEDAPQEAQQEDDLPF